MATIIFDLDGTLVDTAPDLIATLNVILSREGLPAVPEDEARSLIGRGARHMLERGLALAGRPGDDLDRLYGDFIAYYADHLADVSRPFPGVEAALDALAGRGCTFAVCTNKLEFLSVRLLNSLGLAGRFVTICGQDTFGVGKPDAKPLLETIAAAGGSAERAILVGDSATDIRCARAANVRVIAVAYGYADVPVAQLEPDRVIAHFDELAAACDAVLTA